MENWNDYRPAAGSCEPCDCVDSLIKKGEQLQKELDKTKDEKRMLGWFISMLRDVFAYNEYSIIDLDMILMYLEQVDNCDIFTKEDYSDIHSAILEIGLATLPITDKAIKNLSESED